MLHACAIGCSCIQRDKNSCITGHHFCSVDLLPVLQSSITTYLRVQMAKLTSSSSPEDVAGFVERELGVPQSFSETFIGKMILMRRVGYIAYASEWQTIQLVLIFQITT